MVPKGPGRRRPPDVDRGYQDGLSLAGISGEEQDIGVEPEGCAIVEGQLDALENIHPLHEDLLDEGSPYRVDEPGLTGCCRCMTFLCGGLSFDGASTACSERRRFAVAAAGVAKSGDGAGLG